VIRRPRYSAPSLPTEVCIECDAVIRAGNQLVSHTFCDDCAPDALARNMEAALEMARAEVAA
jgi:hypothetical protein